MSTDGITKGERVSLRTIVKDRFSVLDQQIRLRESEIQVELTNKIKDDAKQELERLNAEAKKFWERSQKLRGEWEEFLRKNPGFEVRGTSGMFPKYDHPPVLQIKDLWERVRKELEQLKNQRGAASLNLSEKRQELLEELAVGALEGVPAREFLNRIPSIDSLLPKPTQTELEAAAKKELRK